MALYANGIWVASGYALYYSIDGKKWTESLSRSSYGCITNANGIWVASADGFHGVYYSIGWESMS
jgi:hypothetical protein